MRFTSFVCFWLIGISGPCFGVEASSQSFAPKPAGLFRLEIDGKPAGLVRASGPAIEAFKKKQLTTIQKPSITIEVDSGAGKPLWKWINTSLSRDFTTKSGAISRRNLVFSTQGQDAAEFHGVWISELAFDALDASSKERVYLKIRIKSRRVAAVKRSAGLAARSPVTTDAETRLWTSDSFRFELGDLPCEDITTVEPFTISRKIIPGTKSAKVTFSDFVFTVPKSGLGPVRRSHRSSKGDTHVLEFTSAENRSLAHVALLGARVQEIKPTKSGDYRVRVRPRGVRIRNGPRPR